MVSTLIQSLIIVGLLTYLGKSFVNTIEKAFLLSKQEEAIHNCADLKAARLNLDSAWEVLSSNSEEGEHINSTWEENFNKWSAVLEEVSWLEEDPCYIPSGLSRGDPLDLWVGEVHYQKNPNLPAQWPNWIPILANK